jgi:predicted glycosyltransferase involved in capsule biosynthesis
MSYIIRIQRNYIQHCTVDGSLSNHQNQNKVITLILQTRIMIYVNVVLPYLHRQKSETIVSML